MAGDDEPAGGGPADPEAGTGARLLAERAARFARRPEGMDQDLLRLVGFERRGTRYAVRLADLVEIRPLKRFCPLPGASPAAPGVFYHRGSILSAHDLPAYLQPGTDSRAAAWVLVCDVAGLNLGVLADEVSDVVEVPRADLRPLPVSFGARAGSFLGLVGTGTMVLDLPALVRDDEFFMGF